jgi:hypothetical protein
MGSRSSTLTYVEHQGQHERTTTTVRQQRIRILGYNQKSTNHNSANPRCIALQLPVRFLRKISFREASAQKSSPYEITVLTKLNATQTHQQGILTVVTPVVNDHQFDTCKNPYQQKSLPQHQRAVS